MSKQTLTYVLLMLIILGIVIPYAALVPFVAQHGLDVAHIIEQAGANRIAAFAWLDVLVSAGALLTAAFSGYFIRPKQALIAALVTVSIGVSAGLPLFLYFTVNNIERTDT